MSDAKDLQSRGAWNQFKGKLQEAWGALTDDDLDRYEGKRDQLIGHVQEKTGREREHLERELDRLALETKYGW